MERNLFSFEINQYGFYTFTIVEPRTRIVEMIDYALANSKGIVYKQNIEIERDQWDLIKEHWESKVTAHAHFKIELGFKEKDDAFIFLLRYKGTNE